MNLRALLLILIAASGLQAGARELSVSQPWASALQFSPVIRYTQASIFGEGAVPSYRGFGYGGEVDYTIGTQDVSMGPYFSYMMNNLKNTASGTQSEKLDGTAMGFGLKIYTPVTYLKFGASQTSVKDKATGIVNNTRTYKSNGLEVGGGINIEFSETIAAGIGLDVTYYKFDANANNLSNRLDYLSYSLALSLRFSIPSISPKER